MKRRTRGQRYDRYGVRAYVKVGGVQRERRFPRGTPDSTIREWRDAERVRLRAERPAAGPRGTFASDAGRYLKAVAAMPSWKDRQRDIGAWLPQFGARARHSIQPWEIRAQLDAWLLDGLAPSTVRHRRTALAQLWSVLDGRNAPNPVRSVPQPRDREPMPRGFSLELGRRILDAMPDRGQAVRGETRSRVNLSKLRLRVILETGIPHAQVATIQPDHFNASRRLLIVLARRKGRGTVPRLLPLTRAGADAVAALLEAHAPATWSRSSMRYAFRRACARVQAELEKEGIEVDLSGLRPYDLRHAWATEVSLRTNGNIRTVAAMLGHAQTKTAERYALAAVPQHLADAVALLDAGSPAGSDS